MSKYTKAKGPIYSRYLHSQTSLRALTSLRTAANSWRNQSAVSPTLHDSRPVFFMRRRGLHVTSSKPSKTFPFKVKGWRVRVFKYMPCKVMLNLVSHLPFLATLHSHLFLCCGAACLHRSRHAPSNLKYAQPHEKPKSG